MLCKNLLAFNRPCGPTSGGIARIWLFDGADFNFTQAAADVVTGAAAVYTAVTIREVGEVPAPIEGAKMLPIIFQREEAEYKYTQSRKGCSVKYEHELDFFLPDLSQLITNWNASVDAAGCCCGVAMAIQLNSGKIFIAGERYVNDEVIDIPLYMVQDGSTGGSGKLVDDPNGQNVVMKGPYTRTLYEFTGGANALAAFE